MSMAGKSFRTQALRAAPAAAGEGADQAALHAAPAAAKENTGQAVLRVALLSAAFLLFISPVAFASDADPPVCELGMFGSSTYGSINIPGSGTCSGTYAFCDYGASPGWGGGDVCFCTNGCDSVPAYTCVCNPSGTNCITTTTVVGVSGSTTTAPEQCSASNCYSISTTGVFPSTTTTISNSCGTVTFRPASVKPCAPKAGTQPADCHNWDDRASQCNARAGCTWHPSSCTQPSDCPAGTFCNPANNKCESILPPAPTCKTTAQPCTVSGSSDNCCKQPTVATSLVCDDLNNPANPLCSEGAGPGEKCDVRVNCVSPYYCEASSGTCRLPQSLTCKGEGLPCSGNYDCCGTLACDSATSKCAPRQLDVCSASSFNDLLLYCGIAGLGMISLIAAVYMAGETMQNPRMLIWAKSEAWEVLFSLFIAGMVVFAISTFCSLKVGEVGNIFTGLPKIYTGFEGKNAYQASMMYLENLAGFGLRNMAAIRYNLGAYEVRTSFQQYKCGLLCFLTLTSLSETSYSGESINLSVLNNLLGVATTSYLAVLFQYFTLQYIVGGLFAVFLPIAIIMRSIPFMRNFGGALIGIIVALYVMYPMAQITGAIAVPYLAQGIGGGVEMVDRTTTNCAGIDVFAPISGPNPVSCIGGDSEGSLIRGWTDFANLPSPHSMTESIKGNVLMFLAAIFLPALEFIVVAALARDISGLLGEEADISRLGQMV